MSRIHDHKLAEKKNSSYQLGMLRKNAEIFGLHGYIECSNRFLIEKYTFFLQNLSFGENKEHFVSEVMS